MSGKHGTRITFLGMGLMGAPMVRRLLATGFQVTVWNRTPEKAQALAECGATVSTTSLDAVRMADVVITMLADGGSVLEVARVISTEIRENALVIDMSSTQPVEARALHALFRAQGAAFLDAPVSGGVIGAQAGTLAIMAGGDEADFHRASSIFNAFGTSTHVGPAGCGQLAKLCNQMIVGGTLALVAEALLLAEAGGADPAAVRRALRGGFAESRILEVHGQRMLDRNFLPGGKVASQLKDLENTLKAAVEQNLELPITERVTEAYRALPFALAGADQSAILLWLEQLNGGTRVGAGTDALP